MKTYFQDREFACHCCGAVKVDPDLLDMLNEAREIAGLPFVVTSGYRCPKHNAAVGSQPSSSHLMGLAVDLKAVGSGVRFRIVEALIKTGFNRIGIGKDFVHADIDAAKPARVAWLY